MAAGSINSLWFSAGHDHICEGCASAYVPLGGVIASDRIIETVLDGPVGMFNHGFTYGGHPVACAAALKNIEIMEREGVVESVSELSPYFAEKLAEVRASHPKIVGDLRGDGFLRAFEFVTNQETMCWDCEVVNARDFVEQHSKPALAEVNLLCRVAMGAEGNPLVQLSPPLVATRKDIDELTALLDSALISATNSAFAHQAEHATV